MESSGGGMSAIFICAFALLLLILAGPVRLEESNITTAVTLSNIPAKISNAIAIFNDSIDVAGFSTVGFTTANDITKAGSDTPAKDATFSTVGLTTANDITKAGSDTPANHATFSTVGFTTANDITKAGSDISVKDATFITAGFTPTNDITKAGSDIPAASTAGRRSRIISKDVTTVASSSVRSTKLVTENSITDNHKQTFEEAEKEITEFINSLLRSLLPKIIGGSGSARLSPKCTAGMMKIFGHIRRLKGWTLKMLDSMGKPTSGILKGTSYSLGNYDQCLDLAVTNRGSETTIDSIDEVFRGKYCRVQVQFPGVVIERATQYHKGMVNDSDLGKLRDIIQAIPYIPLNPSYMNHYIGMCFPSTCTTEDLNQLVKLIPFPGSAALDHCEVKATKEVDSTQLIVVCLFLMLASLVVFSTGIDWLFHSKKREKSSQAKDKRPCFSLSISFSLCSNTKRLMRNIEEDANGLLAGQSVRGIFVASVVWVIVGHTYLFPNEGYFLQMSSLENLKSYWNQWYFTFLMSFPLATEALFVCYGFLLTYDLWQPTLNYKDIEINVISLIVKNYIRLALPLLLCFGITLLFPLFGTGPFYEDLLGLYVERCKSNAGAHFGMYSNFLDKEQQCFPHLWFVSCLAQLTFLGIFLSWLLSRSMKIGVSIIMLLCMICSAVIGTITLHHGFPPSYLAYFSEETSNLFWKMNLSLPITHFGSYAAGMLTGILVARKDRHRARMCLSVIGWGVCLALLFAVEYGIFRAGNGTLSRVWIGAFAGIHKTAFGISIAWILVACAFDIGGFINSIFSWRIFDPLFRISYYAYVFHFPVIAYVVSVAREHFAYNHLELVLRATSFIALTYFIVYFFYMLLDMPLSAIKIALWPKRSRQIDVTPVGNFKVPNGNFTPNSSVEGNCKLWSINESYNGISY